MKSLGIRPCSQKPNETAARPFFSKTSSREAETPPFFAPTPSIVPPKLQAESVEGDLKEQEEPLQTKRIEGATASDPVQRQPETDEESKPLQAKGAGEREAPSSVRQGLGQTRGAGQAMASSLRENMEESFGRDFSEVRLHTSDSAQAMNRDLNAKAFTHGRDVYFNSGEFNVESREGRHLLAHELAHVVQQSTGLRRQATSAAEGEKAEKPKINYATAKLQNSYFATPNALGWATKLATVANAPYNSWAELWDGEEYDEFAHQVAAYQISVGMPKRDVDGILGLKTWSRIGGLGEAIAGIQTLTWRNLENLCTIATKERIWRGNKLTTGEELRLSRVQESPFNTILQSRPELMSTLTGDKEQYRGTGAAGAMVFIGLGTFVSEDDIWAGNLQPGAVMQGWWHEDDFNLLRLGEVEEGGRPRALQQSDLHQPAGTSFVFVRYDSDTHDKLWVRHFGDTVLWDKSYFDKWIAANVSSPS